jgi:hypothetical protein
MFRFSVITASLFVFLFSVPVFAANGYTEYYGINTEGNIVKIRWSPVGRIPFYIIILIL